MDTKRGCRASPRSNASHGTSVLIPSTTRTKTRELEQRKPLFSWLCHWAYTSHGVFHLLFRFCMFQQFLDPEKASSHHCMSVHSAYPQAQARPSVCLPFCSPLPHFSSAVSERGEGFLLFRFFTYAIFRLFPYFFSSRSSLRGCVSKFMCLE